MRGCGKRSMRARRRSWRAAADEASDRDSLAEARAWRREQDSHRTGLASRAGLLREQAPCSCLRALLAAKPASASSNASKTARAVMPVMQRWSIGHSRSMQGRHQTLGRENRSATGASGPARKRRRLPIVGRPEDRDDRRADGRGQVHRAGIVGHDRARLRQQPGERRPDRSCPARSTTRVAAAAVNRSAASCDFAARGGVPAARRQATIESTALEQQRRQLGKALGRPLLRAAVRRAGREDDEPARSGAGRRRSSS